MNKKNKKIMTALLIGSAIFSITACTPNKDAESSVKEYEPTTESAENVSVEDSESYESVILKLEKLNPTDYIELPEDYMTNTLTKISSEITEEELTDAITERLNSYKSYKDILDRPVQSGDVVNLDFDGYLNGELLDGASGKAQEIEIGSGEFLDDFEQSIIGHENKENFQIDVKFPEDYYAGELAGKTAQFDVTINAIYEVTIPQLTDEDCKEFGIENVNNAEDFKNFIKEQLQEDKDRTTRTTNMQNVLSSIRSRTKVLKYPEEEKQDLIDIYTETYEEYASQFDLDLDAFREKYLNMTEEEFEQTKIDYAEGSILSAFITDEIQKLENLTFDEETKTLVQQDLAYQYGYSSSDDLISVANDNGETDELNIEINQACVLYYLADKATYEDKLFTPSTPTTQTVEPSEGLSNENSGEEIIIPEEFKEDLRKEEAKLKEESQ